MPSPRSITRSPGETRRQPFVPRWIVTALVCLSLTGSSPAFATNGTWSSTAATSAWQTAANWIGGNLPGLNSGTVNPDTAIFSLASSTTLITPDANRNLEFITFDGSASSYTIGTTGGNALLLTAGGTIQNTSALVLGAVETINAPLTLEGSYTFANNSMNPTLLVFGGPITDAASGFQTLAISGLNNMTISSAIGGGTGTIALTKSGNGTLTLNGNNTFTGGVTINSGVISLANAGALNSTTPNLVNLSSGSAILTLGGISIAVSELSGSGVVQNSNASNTTLTVNPIPGIDTFSGTLQDGSGGGKLALTKNGSGTFVLSGNNAFSGGVTINSGLLQLGSSGALNSVTPNAIAFGAATSNGTLSLSGNNLAVSSLNSNANVGTPVVQNASATPATLTINGITSSTYAGVLQDGAGGGPLGLTVASAGLILGGNNTFTGGVTLNGGFIQLSSAGGLNAAGVNALTFGAASTGTLILNGNSVTVSSLNSNATVGSPSIENTNGTPATLIVNDVGNDTFAGAILNGGSAALSLTKSGPGSLTLSGTNSFTGTLTVAGGTFNMNSSLAGNVTNQSVLVYNGGTIGGRLTNAGSVIFNAPFTAGNGLDNDSSLSIAAGQSITLGGAGLDNEGTLTMTGGTFNLGTSTPNLNRGNFNLSATLSLSSGPFQILLNNQGSLTLNGGLINGSSGMLTNGAGGTISGTGTISSGLNNSAGAIIVGPGTINVTQGFSNGGGVQLTAINANLTGGSISNAGSIQGFGNLGNAVNNSGIVEASGGTLFITGATGSLGGNGTLTVDAGAKLLITQGLAMNSGIINLTGGTFDNNNHPLNNIATGQISGWGIFRTGGSGLDNNASITFSGGTTTVNGPVTNENARTITIAQNPAIFTGLVTNNIGGTFNTVNTTATFAGGFTNNGSSNFIKVGGGTLQIPAAPTLKTASALSIGDAGTLRFAAVSGSATIGTGVTATVADGATLELAGSVSALSSATNRVNIVNNSSAAAGILVSGTNQQVGNIDGSGATLVNAGSDLIANRIVQSALIIGGSANSAATVTIDASDASGHPLAGSPLSLLVGLDSLTTSDLIGAGDVSFASLSDAAISSENPADLALGGPVVSGNAVPEPATLSLALLVLSGVIGYRIAFPANSRRSSLST